MTKMLDWTGTCIVYGTPWTVMTTGARAVPTKVKIAPREVTLLGKVSIAEKCSFGPKPLR